MENMGMIFKITFPITIFVMLYIIAFISNIHDRHNDDILFISKGQWKAIFLMMLPTLIAVFRR